jgi:DNA-binding NarL/FixJ family response regulator
MFFIEQTVSLTPCNIFSKLDVADHTEAILRARKAGLGPAPD